MDPAGKACYIFSTHPPAEQQAPAEKRGARYLTRDDPTGFAAPPAFGPFRVLHQIGVGALGPVFRTYEPTRDRLVAVKVFRLDLTPEQASALADELNRAVDAGLVHPSIVEPVAAGLEGTVAYRAEEYVAAESLDVAMRHYAPATLDKALPFISQLASAIDAARSAGVGHGALHPRDIFVTPDEARATGFGVVDALDRLRLRAPIRRPYSAPERIAGQPWSTPADVFSLGAIAFELLTGRRPSGLGDQMGSLVGAPLGSNIEAIHTVLARAMHEDPAQRFESAGAFTAALQQAAGVEMPVNTGRDETEGALDDFATEARPTIEDSPREVARKAIAARKRQARPKPPIETPAPLDEVAVEPAPAAGSPRALFDDVPVAAMNIGAASAVADATSSSVTHKDAIADIVAAPADVDAAAASAGTEVAAPAPIVSDDLVESVIANAEAETRNTALEREPEAVERALESFRDVPLHDVELPASEMPDLAKEIAPIAADHEDRIAEPLEAAASLGRDTHDRVVAVDEFRAREGASPRDPSEAVGRRDPSMLRADRSWARAHERPASTPDRMIVPAIKAPVDSIDLDIPYVPVDEMPSERPRSAMLERAVILILGLVLGYMAGYVVGGREQAQDANAARNTAPSSGSAPSSPASSFSEGTVTPTTGRPSPAAASDAPSRSSDTTRAVATASKASSPAAAAAKPAAAATNATAPAAKSRTGTIVVTSNPSKASVTVNGKWTGRTPLTIERPFGEYAIRVVQPGYEVVRRSVTLSSSSASSTIDATLRATAPAKPKPAPTPPVAPKAESRPARGAAVSARQNAQTGVGEIFIDSRPQGARVLIDGKPQGVTPLRLTGQTVGVHEVRLELADHQPWTTTTRVVAGATARVTGSLDRLLR
jgi:hypothetical protein